MANHEKVSIFIDGGNFHHLVLKKLHIQELEFAFDNFVRFLANNREISSSGKRFYVGTVREKSNNPRSKKAMSRQTKLFTSLKSSDWEIKTSKLRTRIEKIIIDDRVINHKDLLRKGVTQIEFERMREKGIDVKIATDLIVGAMDNKYDTAIIVSSDGDLIPAINWVKFRTRKKIEYVGFSIIDKLDTKKNTRPLQTMITHSDIQRILVRPDLAPFIIPTTKSFL